MNFMGSVHLKVSVQHHSEVGLHKKTNSGRVHYNKEVCHQVTVDVFLLIVCDTESFDITCLLLKKKTKIKNTISPDFLFLSSKLFCVCMA